MKKKSMGGQQQNERTERELEDRVIENNANKRK